MMKNIHLQKETIGLELLAILFIGLKLTGVISWSWLWVLAPIWIPVGIVLLIMFSIVAAAYWVNWKK